MKMLRVLLVDDHTIVREGLRTLLLMEKDIEVVAEAEDGNAAVRMAQKTKPDVVVMDVGMPNLNGVDATYGILKAVPNTPVIALSVHSDRRFVKGMLTAGARAYLLKNCAGEELIAAIRAVVAGQVYVSPQVSGVVVNEFVRQLQGERSRSLLALTEREREVLRFLALGNSNKEVASELGVSSKTVETHRQHIMEKLECHSIADLTRFAIREGLVSAEE